MVLLFILPKKKQHAKNREILESVFFFFFNYANNIIY